MDGPGRQRWRDRPAARGSESSAQPRPRLEQFDTSRGRSVQRSVAVGCQWARGRPPLRPQQHVLGFIRSCVRVPPKPSRRGSPAPGPGVRRTGPLGRPWSGAVLDILGSSLPRGIRRPRDQPPAPGPGAGHRAPLVPAAPRDRRDAAGWSSPVGRLDAWVRSQVPPLAQGALAQHPCGSDHEVRPGRWQQASALPAAARPRAAKASVTQWWQSGGDWPRAGLVLQLRFVTMAGRGPGGLPAAQTPAPHCYLRAVLARR